MTWKEDESAQLIFNSCMENAYNPIERNKSGVPCAICGKELIVVYHENGLYSVSCRRCRTVTLLNATDPSTAAKWQRHHKKQGQWDEIGISGNHKCSECGFIDFTEGRKVLMPFCPCCGADMRKSGGLNE